MGLESIIMLLLQEKSH